MPDKIDFNAILKNLSEDEMRQLNKATQEKINAIDETTQKQLSLDQLIKKENIVEIIAVLSILIIFGALFFLSPYIDIIISLKYEQYKTQICLGMAILLIIIIFSIVAFAGLYLRKLNDEFKKSQKTGRK